MSELFKLNSKFRISFYYGIFLFCFIQNATAHPLIVEKYSDGSGAALISVDLNISGIIKRFNLDTGSKTTMVAPDEQTLALPVINVTHGNGGFANFQSSCDIVQLPLLEFNNQELKSQHVKRCNLGDGSYNNLGTGIMSQMSGSVMNLNFDSLSIEFKETFPPSLKRNHSQGFKINFKVHGLPAIGAFDTGAALTAVDKEFVKQHPKLFKLVKRSVGMDINNQMFEISLYQVKEIQIGNLKLGRTLISAFDFSRMAPDVQFIIGNNIITKANWFFDLKNDYWSNQTFKN